MGVGLDEDVGREVIIERAGQGQRKKPSIKDSGLSAWRTGVMGGRRTHLLRTGASLLEISLETFQGPDTSQGPDICRLQKKISPTPLKTLEKK